MFQTSKTVSLQEFGVVEKTALQLITFIFLFKKSTGTLLR